MSDLQVPPELARIAAFVNTLDLESGADAIAGPAGLKAWLVEQGLLGKSVRVGDDDVVRARALRESLRAALQANEVADLNRELRGLPLQVQFDADGWPAIVPAAAGVEGALGRLVAGIATAVAAGTWSRLKVCASDTCRWAFYDNSKNRSGRWCSMRVCGNRSKIRTYRNRG